MTFKDALDFMLHESGLNMTHKDAVYCYGMSKQTVLRENVGANESSRAAMASSPAGPTAYFRLQFVEFLEMLGRIADMVFIPNEEDVVGLPYDTLKCKLEFLLDVVMPKMIGCRRREAPLPQDDPSASDDSDY